VAAGIRRAEGRLPDVFPLQQGLDRPARPHLAAAARFDQNNLECPWCGARPAETGRVAWQGPVLEAVCRGCGLVLRVFVGAEPIELDDLAAAVHPGYPND
jgi:hypothetical protein